MNKEQLKSVKGFNIQIDGNYRITADSRQFILEQKTKPKTEGKEGAWKSIGFYRNLDLLLQDHALVKLRMSDVSTLAEALKETKRIIHALSDVLTPRFKVETN